MGRNRVVYKSVNALFLQPLLQLIAVGGPYGENVENVVALVVWHFWLLNERVVYAQNVFAGNLNPSLIIGI